MAIALNDNLQINAPKPVDNRLLNNTNIAYTDLSEALIQTAGKRHLGLEVLINAGVGGNAKYWFKDGINDEDLVLMTTGSSGGSATIYFDNGLNYANGTAGLGGTLKDDVTISGDNGNMSLYLGGYDIEEFLNELVIGAQSIDVNVGNDYTAGLSLSNSLLSWYTNGVDQRSAINMTNSGGIFIAAKDGDNTIRTQLELKNTGAVFSDLRTTATGIEYAADYSANFTDRSIVDKQYVDTIASGGNTYQNGLTKSSTTVSLGGPLVDSTTLISGESGTKSLEIGGYNETDFLGDIIITSAGYLHLGVGDYVSYIDMSDSNIEINSGGTFQFNDAASNSMTLDSNGFRMQNSKGKISVGSNSSSDVEVMAYSRAVVLEASGDDADPVAINIRTAAGENHDINIRTAYNAVAGYTAKSQDIVISNNSNGQIIIEANNEINVTALDISLAATENTSNIVVNSNGVFLTSSETVTLDSEDVIFLTSPPLDNTKNNLLAIDEGTGKVFYIEKSSIVPNYSVNSGYAGTSGYALNAASSVNSYQLNSQLPSYYLNRSNHTGTQTASTISDFNSAVDARIPTAPTFSNGLTNTSGTVRLGGALTQNTTLAGSYTFTIGSSALVVSGTSGFVGDATFDGNVIIKGQAYAEQGTLTDASTISWNLNTDPNATVTLGASRTLANPTNMKSGGSYYLTVKQDATGTRALSFGTAYKWPGGYAPILTETANAIDIITFISDGTYMYGVAQYNFI